MQPRQVRKGEEVVIPGLDSNYGSIVECKVFSASLKSGHAVRWVFEFKKMSKLKGDFPLFQVFGQIIPSSRGLTAQEARSVLLEEWTRQWSPLQRGSTLFSE